MATNKDRPKLCPCQKSCTALYNGMAFDDRIKDGDLDEGYSGDCIGKSKPTTYEVGGQVHTNDMNHCIITPLKGVIRFQVCEEDIRGMLHMAKHVLHYLDEARKCCECGVTGMWVHWIVTPDKKRHCCRCYYLKQEQQGKEEV